MGDDVEPDLLAEYREFFIGDAPDDVRDDLAAEMGMTRPEVDALIVKMSEAWDALDQETDGSE